MTFPILKAASAAAFVCAILQLCCAKPSTGQTHYAPPSDDIAREFVDDFDPDFVLHKGSHSQYGAAYVAVNETSEEYDYRFTFWVTDDSRIRLSPDVDLGKIDEKLVKKWRIVVGARDLN